MTTSDTRAATSGAGRTAAESSHDAAVTALSDELVRHARMLHVMKSQLAGSLPQGLEGASVGLLMQLVKCGPSRQGELADATHLDPSTVSRYVGDLVKRGLAERRPDPADGRAVQLAATDAGHSAADALVRRRKELFHGVLAHWPTDDVRTLTTLLGRLNDSVETSRDLRPATGAPAEES